MRAPQYANEHCMACDGLMSGIERTAEPAWGAGPYLSFPSRYAPGRQEWERHERHAGGFCAAGLFSIWVVAVVRAAIRQSSCSPVLPILCQSTMHQLITRRSMAKLEAGRALHDPAGSELSFKLLRPICWKPLVFAQGAECGSHPRCV